MKGVQEEGKMVEDGEDRSRVWLKIVNAGSSFCIYIRLNGITSRHCWSAVSSLMLLPCCMRTCLLAVCHCSLFVVHST